LSDTDEFGDDILSYMKTNSKKLGLLPDIFDLIYENFFDLYCKKPATPEVTPKKLDGFIARIKLQVPPQDWVPSEGEEGEPTKSPIGLPLKAVVRIRVPFKRPIPKVTEEKEDSDKEKASDAEDEAKAAEE
jgi:hypothetical protein